jgi:translation initiation factor IF-1
VPNKKEKQPLSVTHPELAKEADGWDAAKISASHSKKLTWICSKEHIFEATIRNRLRNQNCSICSFHRVLQGFNDLATTHPGLANQAHGWDPTKVISAGHRNFEWKCEKGHIWKNSISNRKGGQNCPYCIGKRALAGFNDLATLEPAVAAEAHGWNPSEFTIGSGKKVPWKCGLGHVWEAAIAQRVSQKTKCPFCSNYRALAGYNDLATTHPQLAKQAHEWDPTSLGAGSGKKVAWKCDKGHISYATVESRAKNDTKCGICINKIVLSGFNDLATTHPDLASQADGWDPQKVTAGSNKRVQWKCSLSHIWKQYVVTRAQGTGCPYCSGYSSWPGFNDLATLNPRIASQADGWDPTTIGYGSGKKMKWKCERGHTWEARVNNRGGDRDIGCPYCSGNLVWVGFNDLATTHPNLAAQADGWNPETIVAGHNGKKSWICESGHRWRAVVSSRAFGEVGCPSCAYSGFDPNLNGYLYFISHPTWEMFQIGITNYPKDRLHSHGLLGWEVLEIRGPMDGHLTQQWETAILRMLKAKGADLSNAEIAGKFDGYSEAWSRSTFEVKSIKELMRLTEQFEEK